MLRESRSYKPGNWRKAKRDTQAELKELHEQEGNYRKVATLLGFEENMIPTLARIVRNTRNCSVSVDTENLVRSAINKVRGEEVLPLLTETGNKRRARKNQGVSIRKELVQYKPEHKTWTEIVIEGFRSLGIKIPETLLEEINERMG